MASQKSDKPKTKTKTQATPTRSSEPAAELAEIPQTNPESENPQKLSEPTERSSQTKPGSEQAKKAVNPLVERPLPPTSKRKWDLPLPWMNDWIETATRTGSILSACEAAKVSMVDVNDARRDVPEFDDAFRLYEEIVDHLIQEIVRQFALAGNANGLRYYFQVIREEMIASQPPVVLSPEEAELAIRNALIAHGAVLDDDLDDDFD